MTWFRHDPGRPDGRYKAAVRRNLELVGGQIGGLLVATAFITAGAVFSAATPLAQQWVVDHAILTHSAPIWPGLVVYLLLGIGVFVTKRICLYRQARAVAELQYEVRNQVHTRLQHLDESTRDGLPTGQLVSRVNSDAGVLVRVLANVPQVIGALIFTVVALIAMLVLSPLLATVTLVMVPVLTWVAARMRAVVQPASWDVQQREGELAQTVDETVSGIRVVKAFGQQDREQERMVQNSRELYGARMRLTRLSAKYESLFGSIPRFGQVAVLALGGWLALEHRISVGTFLAFASYLMMLVAPARIVAGLIGTAQRAGAAATRIFEVLDSVPLIADAPDARELRVTAGVVTFDGVRAGYPHAEPVLDGFSLTIAPGETVALVGASGSGKSTAALLLPRLREAQGGTVRIDGQDVRDVTLSSLRRQVAIVFEESFLFAGSVRENIAYGRPDAPFDEIVAAARTAGVHDLIAALPEGYDSETGERGSRFSGGQRQRIAIARALVTGAPVLVLDDVTSAVDAHVEAGIVAGLRAATLGRTTLLISHRRATLALADRIAVLDDGRIIDDGTHDELIARCPRYAELLASAEADQAEDALEEQDSAWGTPRPRAVSPAAAEMMAKLATLPPADEDPSIDRAAAEDESRFSLRRFLAPYRTALAVSVPLFVLGAATTVAGPYLYEHGIDGGVRSGSGRVLVIVVAVMALVAVADLFAVRAMTLVSGRLGQRIVIALRLRVWVHLKRLSLDFYERHRSGSIMTRVVTDVESLTGVFSSGLAQAVVAVFTFAGVLAAMLWMSPALTLLTSVVLVPFVLVTAIFQRLSSKPYADAREQVATMNADLRESLAGVRETQVFGQQDRRRGRFEETTRAYVDARMAAQRLASLYFPFVELLADVAAVFVLGAGAWLIGRGHLQVGALVAFMLYINLFFTPVQQMSTLFDSWQQARVSMRRVQELMDEQASVRPATDPVRPAVLRGEIELRGVGFTYPDGREALRGIDLRIAAGETLAVIGESGSGKSTLAKLIVRFHDPVSGAVLVDGVDLRDIDERGYRARLGYVPQEPYLFSGSVRDNIAYARPDATDAEVERAARRSGAHEMIAGLDGGYRHVLDERGASLSAGQRQLLCLARAELVDPVVLLLDEATSNLDAAAEAAVHDAMRRMAGRRTTVVIAHRLAVAEDADRVAVLSAGRLVELGPPAELRTAGGPYSRLVAAATVPA
ncbi:ABC transporter ATP-binding protein [Winogradskya consettensis]|uniref:ABC transporter ATP-binding protein n=1 Tax=Winogradskya consettensis TaxID=113560 RepID=A0A919VM08_9ACTN|nr:ABC transporter ATP-binding protein [Actinoplanes consettensis]GIM68466.1 ABC transporter ATP-binding protein [Actinoplanes consettensis]